MSDNQMSFKQFEEYVKRHFQQKYDSNVSVEIRDIWKNNGIRRRGLSIIWKGEKVTPTIYLEEFYKEYLKGISMEGILSGIEDVYLREANSKEFEIEYFNQYESVKDTLRVKLINYQKNIQLLEQVPYIRILDLALVCYSIVENSFIQNGAITIFTAYLDMWQISEKELFTKAIQNSQQYSEEVMVEISQLLNEFQQELLEDSSKLLLGEEDKGGMYVLTNSQKMNGAAVLCYPGILEKCAKCLQSDFYLLPSSIHEWILMRAEENKEQELLSMVQEVNDEQVAEEEILSYHIYKYERETKCLEDLVTKESRLM